MRFAGVQSLLMQNAQLHKSAAAPHKCNARPHLSNAAHRPKRFGFNVGMGMVDGLWVGGSEAATDFALIVYQIRLLGYNAVRLPFTWRDLEMAPRNLEKDCSPVTIDGLKRRLISPHVMAKHAGKKLPGNVAPQRKRAAGYCNQYLPKRSNYHRLLFVMQTLISQGIYVVLDYQPMVGGVVTLLAWGEMLGCLTSAVCCARGGGDLAEERIARLTTPRHHDSRCVHAGPGAAGVQPLRLCRRLVQPVADGGLPPQLPVRHGQTRLRGRDERARLYGDQMGGAGGPAGGAAAVP